MNKESLQERPGLEVGEGGVGGEVDLGGGDGDVAMVEGPTVGILGLRFIVAVLAHHPPVVVATEMMTFRDLVVPCTGGHATHPDALEHRHEREVDIQTDAFWQALPEHLSRDRTDKGTEGFEVGIVAMVT